ncbi:MAG TPA: nucleobase:cation symporter-2 family protein [Solirubrobacteraceae bacterium]|jgi:NCS2 family nucleobase:cation symporter-2|nr:nucleobase:cation symporter-2 family protein [Solirubrobacteraceae bacterium]
MSDAAVVDARGATPTHAGPGKHPVDEVLPARQTITLGLQHLFIMYAGAVAVPLIVGPAVHLDKHDIGLLIGADLLVSGICTFIQAVGIGKLFGVRLPVVAGATFTVVSPMISITNQFGLRSFYGALLISGIFGLIIAKPFSMILRFFPPLVAGTVIAVIGLSLIGADVGLIASNDPTAASYGAVSHILLAGFVVLMIVVITRLFSGFVSQVAVLLAILLGTLLAWPMGLLHFTSVNTVDWFGGPSIFHFGGPRFQASAIISMCIVILVTYTESTADMLAVGEMVDKDVSPRELARGLRTDGLSAFIASFTNSFPDTAYAENVGIVGMTGVRSRWVVAVCGVFLVILGLIPKVSQIIADIPGPVIGGATVMFAMVTAIGIRTLAKVNFEGNNSLLIVAVLLSIGLIPAIAPTFYSKFPPNFQVIFGSSITSTVIIVFVLNLVFNHWVNWPPRAGMLRTAMSYGAVTPTETTSNG